MIYELAFVTSKKMFQQKYLTIQKPLEQVLTTFSHLVIHLPALIPEPSKRRYQEGYLNEVLNICI